jgi:hypothetical protein
MGSNHAPRLPDQVSIVCRRRHLSPRTEDSYRSWIRQVHLFPWEALPNPMSEQGRGVLPEPSGGE